MDENECSVVTSIFYSFRRPVPLTRSFLFVFVSLSFFYPPSRISTLSNVTFILPLCGNVYV